MLITSLFSNIIANSIFGLYMISMLFMIGVIMLENRSPLKTLSWILVLILVPIGGIILYVFFGQNFRKKKIIRRKGLKNDDRIKSVAQTQGTSIQENTLFNSEQINDRKTNILLQLNNSDSVITTGNKVTLLNNGKVKFDHLLNDLKEAKNFIHLQYYILALDNIGNQVISLLKKKAKEGVEVRVIVDDVGSWDLKNGFLKSLRKDGVEIYSFLQVRFPSFTSKVNYRNHRKIVIIDGQKAYMGGINIADRYIYGTKKLGSWRDTHIKIEGDAVASLQAIFLIDWYFVSQKELIDSKYFPIIIPCGNKTVQISSSGPDSDWPAIMMGFIKLISTAKDYVYIATPYFMPNESVAMALKIAAMGGVDVRLLIPDKSDALFTKYSSRSYIREMIQAGVNVYLYKKGFVHSKVIVSDDIVSSIGSTNMDFRSFEQNFEITAFIYDSDFAKEVKNTFIEDFKYSHYIQLKEWRKRPLKQKIIESFARIFSPLL